MKVAVIGSGIAGNVAAYHLAREHEITVFEAAPRTGGHTHTVELEHSGRPYAIDTGFVVFNERNYPRFTALLDELGVVSKPSRMSFSIRDATRDFEYNGTSLNTLFAARRNLLSPKFFRMLRDVLRFNREAPALLDAQGCGLTLREYLERGRYSAEFRELYLVPMGAAIWSAAPGALQSMPAEFFVRFFANHGMLTVNQRPVWRVVEGGSAKYVERLVAGHRRHIRLDAPVHSVRRLPAGVEITARGHAAERFDAVFFACHSDQALGMLADPSTAERRVLGAIRYQTNEVVLHTDAALMPRRRRAWAAWNYHLLPTPQATVAVTYNMNILQGLDAPVDFCVTLNNTAAVAPEKILRTFEYSHPVFTPAAIAAQAQHGLISGPRDTYYCGAYWRNGFHEDGVVSALTALDQFNDRLRYEQRDLLRAS